MRYSSNPFKTTTLKYNVIRTVFEWIVISIKHTNLILKTSMYLQHLIRLDMLIRYLFHLKIYHASYKVHVMVLCFIYISRKKKIWIFKFYQNKHTHLQFFILPLMQYSIMPINDKTHKPIYG